MTAITARASWRRDCVAEAAAAGRHRPRRPGIDRLHQRHHRRAQGLRPVPPRRPRAVRHLREASGRPKPGDVFLTSAPMAFTFGLGMTPMFPLRFGAASATIEQASPPALLEAIVKFGVTHLGTAPTAYKAMLSQPALDKALKTLRYCISAGEHLPEATWRGVARAHRHRDHRRHRLDRDDAHLRLRRGRRHPPRLNRQGGAGIRSDRARRRRQAAGRGRRPARDQGPDRLPLPR